MQHTIGAAEDFSARRRISTSVLHVEATQEVFVIGLPVCLVVAHRELTRIAAPNECETRMVGLLRISLTKVFPHVSEALQGLDLGFRDLSIHDLSSFNSENSLLRCCCTFVRRGKAPLLLNLSNAAVVLFPSVNGLLEINLSGPISQLS